MILYTAGRWMIRMLLRCFAEQCLVWVEGYDDAVAKPDADSNTTVTPDPTKQEVEAPDDKTLVVHMWSLPYFDKHCICYTHL